MKDDLPAIGPMEGGFFTGAILINGQRYGIAVAPKKGGDLKGEWGEFGEIIEARHLADGMANTQAMAEAGSQIAQSVLALTLNGCNDWYIPALDEEELIYRNLKPGTNDNYCLPRDGLNMNSIPPGHPYDKQSPAQTTIEAFRTGGDEAMEEAWYWSSTQYSAYSAYVQDFGVGDQDYGFKGDSFRVRAVRRFLIAN